jgi:hypothetical protein
MSAPTLPEYAPLPQKTSTWEDCLDIFYNPREVFERRRDGRFAVQWLVLVVGIGALAYLAHAPLSAVLDLETPKALANMRAQGLSEQQIAQAASVNATVGRFLPAIMAVYTLFGSLLLGLVFWLLARLLGATMTIAQGITVWILASYVNLASMALLIVQSFVVDANAITHKHAYSTSLARFVGASGADPLLVKLSALADPFVIWSGFLLGLGGYVVGRMEKERAAVLGVVASVLYVLLNA